MCLPLPGDDHMLLRLKSTSHFNIAEYHLRMRRFPEAAAGFSEVVRLSGNRSFDKFLDLAPVNVDGLTALKLPVRRAAARGPRCGRRGDG